MEVLSLRLLGSVPQLNKMMSIILMAIGFCGLSGNLFGGFICDHIGFFKAYKLGTILRIVLSLGIFFTQRMMLLNVIIVFCG